MGAYTDPKGFGSFPIWLGLGLGCGFIPKGFWVWVRPCLDLEGFGWGSESDPRGLGLGPSVSGPKMGLGVDPFLFRPKWVWVWVLLCLDLKGFRMGSESGPKGFRFGVSVWTQNRFGCESFHFQAKKGLKMAPWLDPIGLGAGSVPKPNGDWVWVLSCQDPK
jgi:hypothetical protein